MKKINLALFSLVITFSSCTNIPATFNANNPNDPDNIAVVTISAIQGVTPPTYGETPVTAIIGTAQYTGTVNWSGSPVIFAGSTVYTATITLTTKTGFTMTGVTTDFFTAAGASLVSNETNTGVITAVFPSTSTAPPAVVTIAAITGIVAPVTGATPVTTAIDATQYTGTVAWSGSPVTFLATTIYTANIVLTPKTGFTLTGVTADFFTVTGATVTNAVNSGALAAVFPATTQIAGANLSYSLPSSISFNMKYVPGGTFPTGTDDLGGNQSITTAYWMAETEVTYELWYAVRTWAKANGYTLNANPGIEGNDGTITVGAGAVPTTAKQEPVTTINWREAMVWCNALTEYYNANNGTDSDLDCAYYTNSGYTTPIRTATDSTTITWDGGSVYSGTEDEPYVKAAAKGFRLPGSMEWECAARYKNGTSWTAGSWASGSTADYTDNVATSLSGVYYRNYTAVSTYTSVTSTAAVKSKNANALGIRDMCGNVWEWCFDWYPGASGSARGIRGGSWSYNASALQVGYVGDGHPYDGGYIVGFRFVRTQ